MTTLTLDGYTVPGTVTNLEGWFGTPTRRRDDQPRSRGKDGDFPSISDYGPRYVTFRGLYRGTSHDDMHVFTDRMAGLFLTGSGDVVVSGHGPAQTAVGEPLQFMPPIYHSDTLVEWAWSVKFPDPRKYGLVERSTAAGPSGTAQTLANAGNYYALPRVNVYNAAFPDGYTIWNGSDFTRVFQPLTTGQVHTIDFATGVAKVQGSTTTEMVGKTRIIRVPPYGSTAVNVRPYPTSLSATATVRWYWRDTWI